jgi:4-hydroxy-tetrahydrodipicolinate synthase
MQLHGLHIPLITPFNGSGEVAVDALEGLARSVLEAGAAGIVALGTTGEPTTLTAEERDHILEVVGVVCRELDKTLIVGTGSNSTEDSRKTLSRFPPDASCAMTVVPYYTRPSEEGIIEHFRALAKAGPVPLLIYNVPYRTGRALSAPTLLRLADLPGVVGFKHAVGGVDEATIEMFAGLPDGFSVLAGDDLFLGPMLALGADGGILASAHVETASFAALIEAWRTGRVAEARRLGRRLTPVSRALFAEPNPAVIKAVLHAMGRIPSAQVRLPLMPASTAATEAALDTFPRGAARY